jgi:hypothetical protein
MKLVLELFLDAAGVHDAAEPPCLTICDFPDTDSQKSIFSLGIYEKAVFRL